MMMLDQKV